MRLVDFKLSEFTLPLAKPLQIGKSRLLERHGLVITLSDENGNEGFGETSPLPALNSETRQQARSELLQLRPALRGQQVPPHLEELSGGFARWLEPYNLSSSVRFGLETAVLNLMASAAGVPLRRLISDCSRDTVSVNALLAGAENEILQKAGTLSAGGFRAAKLKVGRQSLEKDISLTRQVRRRVGDSISLRLDANRAWNVEEALAFSNQVAECDIEYIEEPVHDYVSLLELVQNRNPAVGVALDESLSELTPDTLPDVPNTAAIILKPTALGLERSIQFARRAAVMGAKAVISSSFESGLALTALAELAACFNTRDVPAGLDTLAWLERDILEEPISVKNGVVELPTTPVQPDDLKWRMLREVTDE